MSLQVAQKMESEKIQSRRVYILEDFYYENLNENNFEEALELVVDTQKVNPGNPAFLNMPISKEDLKGYYRQLLTYKLTNSVLDIIFYYKGKPSGYAMVNDLYEKDEPDYKYDNKDLKEKLDFDHELIVETKKQYPPGGRVCMAYFGTNSKNCFPNQSNIQFMESYLHLYFMGWVQVGGYSYNIRMKAIMLRFGSKEIVSVSPKLVQQRGILKYFDYNDKDLIFSSFMLPLNMETINKYFKPRLDQVKQLYEQNLYPPCINGFYDVPSITTNSILSQSKL